MDTLNNALAALRLDYATKMSASRPETETMLYAFFGTEMLSRYGFFQQAKSLILTSPERDDSRHLEVVLSYDANSWKGEPLLYLTMPSDAPRTNSLGLGEGNFEEVVIAGLGSGDGSYKRQFVRRRAATYQLMIMSANKNATIILYYLFNLLILACHEHLEMSGISNLSYSGGDLNFRDNVPDKLFGKSLNLTFEYNLVSTEFNINQIIDQINIVIQLKNDLGDSFDDGGDNNHFDYRFDFKLG